MFHLSENNSMKIWSNSSSFANNRLLATEYYCLESDARKLTLSEIFPRFVNLNSNSLPCFDCFQWLTPRVILPEVFNPSKGLNLVFLSFFEND